eukprot:26100-Pelagomonas_calceolata.AAC.1
MISLVLSHQTSAAWGVLRAVPQASACSQDEEHVILDCLSQDLTDLRTQSQHLFSSAPLSSASRLRNFMNQADVLGLAMLVFACTFVLQLSCPCRQ